MDVWFSLNEFFVSLRFLSLKRNIFLRADIWGNQLTGFEDERLNLGWRRIFVFIFRFRINHSLTFRSRKALLMTETELRLIAAPAMIGLSSKPKNG